MQLFINRFITLCFLLTSYFLVAQNEIAYYPPDWSFKNTIDVVDFSQIKTMTKEVFEIDENKEYPFSKEYWSWNNTYQLTDYRFINQPMKEMSFDVRINYTNPNGNQIKTITIFNTVKEKMIEERQYSYGSFNVDKIVVKRYLLNTNPDVFEVTYQGNDNDYIKETVFTSNKKISSQTKSWYNYATKSLKKEYYKENIKTPVETEHLKFDALQKPLERTIGNLGVTTTTKYNYRSRKVEVFGDETDYKELINIEKDSEPYQKFEYEYDDNYNWIVRKTYQMKNNKWLYTTITKRTITYKN